MRYLLATVASYAAAIILVATLDPRPLDGLLFAGVTFLWVMGWGVVSIVWGLIVLALRVPT